MSEERPGGPVERIVGRLRAWADDADAHGKKWAPVSQETLRYLADTLEQFKRPTGAWTIDHSAGRPILVYENCSVIEDEQARYVLGLIAADMNKPPNN